jgi:hypothetical protein
MYKGIKVLIVNKAYSWLGYHFQGKKFHEFFFTIYPKTNLHTTNLSETI